MNRGKYFLRWKCLYEARDGEETKEGKHEHTRPCGTLVADRLTAYRRLTASLRCVWLTPTLEEDFRLRACVGRACIRTTPSVETKPTRSSSARKKTPFFFSFDFLLFSLLYFASNFFISRGCQFSRSLTDVEVSVLEFYAVAFFFLIESSVRSCVRKNWNFVSNCFFNFI